MTQTHVVCRAKWMYPMKDPYFHIEWIIDLIKAQEPDRKDLIADLANAKRKSWLRQPYISLVSADRPNKPNSAWQFDENIVLEHETEATIILDVLKGGRVGGIEFLNSINQS